MRSLALLLAVVLSSSIALADGASTLERARDSYEDLRYDEASALLEGALAGGELDAAQRREALLLAGIVEVIRGDDERAGARFRELLEAAPDAALPSGLSPKITRVFDEVRERLETERAQRGAPGPSPTALSDVDAPEVGVASPQPAQSTSASSARAVPEAEEDGLSSVALGVAAGAAVAAVVVVASAGALLFLVRAQPPESSLGTMQLP